MNEIWEPTVEFPDHYAVSDFGNVKRTMAPGAGRVLRPRGTGYKSAYYSVQLSVNGVLFSRYIHRLVAERFIGLPVPPQDEINHKNGDKTDNGVGNLEWCTPAENIRHRFHVLKRGYPPETRARGEHNGNSKLGVDDVLVIRKLFAEGQSLACVAARFCLSATHVGHIVHRDNWKHV